MTYDPSKKITISYNPLNLPSLVEFDNSDFIEYTYTATGTKLRKTVSSWKTTTGGITDYAGQFLYQDNELSCIFTPVGRIVPMQYNDETFWKYEYNLKDHLGNTRIVFAAHPHGQPEVMQQTSYYPFGMTLQQQNFGGLLNQPNKLLYNGKELQDDELAGVSLDWYDYGAQFYDAQIGRWFVGDNKAENYYGITQYAYAINNPLRFIDPDGNEIVDATGMPIKYNAESGWSSNATNDIKIIHSGLMQTETGIGQWNKAYDSESKIEMIIVEQKLYSQKTGGLSLGQTNQALGFDLESAEYVKTNNVMKIEISLGSINESFDGKNKGLTLRQAIAATAGHEIEHTTEENRDIGVQDLKFPSLSKDEKGRDRIEIKPNTIGNRIRKESRNGLRLEPIIKKALDDRDMDPSKGGFY
jgi:RHS repeat-associated protein